MEKSKGCFYVDPEPPPLLLLTQITTEDNIVEQGWRDGAWDEWRWGIVMRNVLLNDEDGHGRVKHKRGVGSLHF